MIQYISDIPRAGVPWQGWPQVENSFHKPCYHGVILNIIIKCSNCSSCEGHGWEIIKHLPYVHASVRSSHFCITLISHSFIKISSPNLQGMFMAVKNCLCKSLALF